MKSIIQSEKRCFICGTTSDLECHHCIHGTANRKNADKYGLKVWLCHKHHTGSNESVHHDSEIDLQFKRLAQKTFEAKYGHDKYMSVFGKNYL